MKKINLKTEKAAAVRYINNTCSDSFWIYNDWSARRS